MLLDADWTLDSNAAEKIGSVSWSGQGVLSIHYTVGSAEFRNWYLYGEPPFRLEEIMRFWNLFHGLPPDGVSGGCLGKLSNQS